MTENKRYTVVCDDINAYSIHNGDECIVFDLFKCDAERICDELNQIARENEQLKKENQFIKHVINEALSAERTELGKSVLKQLKQQIEVR